MKVKLSGWPELEKALAEELPKATARNSLTRAGKQAMERIRTRMARLAPFNPDELDDAGRHFNEAMESQVARAKLARKLGTDRQSGVVILTGPAPKGKKMRGIAHALEYGTGERFQKKTGKSVGFLPAEPYVRPAIDGQGEAVIAEVKQALAEQIEKAKARIARKAARAKG